MADIYSKVEAYNAVGGNDAGATVGANSRKFGVDTFSFGTRNISPLVLYSAAGDFASDQSSNSNFYKVMLVVQGRCEIFGIGEVGNNNATLFVADDTLFADSGDDSAPNDEEDLDLLEAEILAATGLTVKVYNGKIANDDVNYDC
jgi:hypothetical protein